MPSQTSFSSEATKALAADAASKILALGPRKGAATVIALEGELGAGKTTFVQGFFRGLGIRRIPASPTFILMRRTPLRGKPFRDVFHVDAYRGTPADFEALGLPVLLRDGSNLFLIEWAERIKELLPPRTLHIGLSHGATSDQRLVTLPSRISKQEIS